MEPSRAFHRTERASAAGVRDLQGGTVDRQLVVLAREGDAPRRLRGWPRHRSVVTGIARLILHDYGVAEDVSRTRWSTPGATSAAFSTPTGSIRGPRGSWCAIARITDGGGPRGLVELPWLMNDGPASDETQAAGGRRPARARSPAADDEQRTSLVLFSYLDLPLAEAAATLGIPIGTMKSRLD